METLRAAMALLLVAVGIATLAPKLRLPTEVLLLLGSLALSFVPGLPHLHLRPDLIFLVFLPPILFAAAYFTSWRDFKANKRPISLMAIGLVLFTSASVAAAAKALVPDMSWPVAYILGAMVSPPDASAATAITRKFGVPRRLITIIEGESLINDATALVIYRFAIAAALTGVFSPGLALAKFVWVGMGGVFMGLATGWVGLWLYQRLTETPAQTLVSFLTAFAAYVMGEITGVSGVISTVVAGLYFGRWLPTHSSAQLRIEAKAAWDLALFVINALVFMLIGLQLPFVLEGLRGYSHGALLLYAVVISVTAILVRLIWVFPATYLPRFLFPVICRKDPSPPLGPVFVLGWTGMRGIVTLAAALALPAEMPHRNLLIFLAYSVILSTLLLPSLTLPFIIRTLGIKSGLEREKDEALARVAAVKEVLQRIDGLKTNKAFNLKHVEEMEHHYQKRLVFLESNLSNTAFSPLYVEDTQKRRLLREIISAERRAILRLRDDNTIHNEVFHQLTRELDLEDLRLRTQRL